MTSHRLDFIIDGMKKYVEKLKLNIDYPIEALGSPKKLLIFDIETTGLSAANSSLYMIAALTLDPDNYILTQWFADDMSDEQDMLKDFFSYLSSFDTVISYNGETFDIPYIKSCALSYHMLGPLDDMRSIDLYKHIRRYRKIFPLDKLNQKSIERFTGLIREDKYSGGELINVYKDYLICKDESLLDMLLLHNKEDVLGLSHILCMLSYIGCINGSFDFDNISLAEDNIKITYKLECKVPVPVNISLKPVSISIVESLLTVNVELYKGTCKFFFEDYKSYYYLPIEDYAIHKSVGMFVDKSARVKATAKTAYTKKDGLFVPIFNIANQNIFYKEYNTYPAYILLDDMPKEPSSLKAYAKGLIAYVL